MLRLSESPSKRLDTFRVVYAVDCIRLFVLLSETIEHFIGFKLTKKLVYRFIELL